MQLLVIVLFLTVFFLMMRGDDGRRDAGQHQNDQARSSREQDQIELLKSRVSALESILLDRRGQFPDGH